MLSNKTKKRYEDRFSPGLHLHMGVTCDGCYQPISGFVRGFEALSLCVCGFENNCQPFSFINNSTMRYVCLDCRNFDYCERCHVHFACQHFRGHKFACCTDSRHGAAESLRRARAVELRAHAIERTVSQTAGVLPPPPGTDVSKTVVFVGNPGAGKVRRFFLVYVLSKGSFYLCETNTKSSLLNALIGHACFECGTSIGTGLTTTASRVFHDGVAYIDTPGLADSQRRDDASKAITHALRFVNGHIGLFFVVTLDSGRVRPDDVDTATCILRSINIADFPFGLIVNKLSRALMARFVDKNAIDIVAESFAFNGRRPQAIHFVARDVSAVDASASMLSNDIRLKLVRFVSLLYLPINDCLLFVLSFFTDLFLRAQHSRLPQSMFQTLCQQNLQR